jgi:hypothetical protein
VTCSDPEWQIETVLSAKSLLHFHSDSQRYSAFPSPKIAMLEAQAEEEKKKLATNPADLSSSEEEEGLDEDEYADEDEQEDQVEDGDETKDEPTSHQSTSSNSASSSSLTVCGISMTNVETISSSSSTTIATAPSLSSTSVETTDEGPDCHGVFLILSFC